MSSALVILAAVGCAEGFGLAEMISNYAKVTTNTGLTIDNGTVRFEPNATTFVPGVTTVVPETMMNETDYEDFDDLEAATENPISRQVRVDPGTIFKYFNGVISLLALMNKFGGGSGSDVSRRRFRKGSESEGYSPAGQARYQPDTATKKFKYQVDQEKHPIGNYPPYNPLAANSADSYTKDGKTSYDADLQQYKTSNTMSEYMAQNQDSNVDVHHQSYSYESPYKNPEGGWNAIAQDYPEYKPGQTWEDSGPKNQWKMPEEYPVYHHPEKKPLDYHDLVLGEPPEDHHHLIEDDRESKRPYSYYFLGRKLWYIPLIFSVYFILYVGALVLKSVARHKIQFPDKLWDLKDEHYKHRRYRKVDEITEMYDNAIKSAKNKFM